jgi:hypothetical protein
MEKVVYTCAALLLLLLLLFFLLQQREEVLQQAASGGAVKDYAGWRVSLKGKRFKIQNVQLFNVTELDGERQCSAFADAAYMHTLLLLWG